MLSADPNETIPYVLATDRPKPVEKRPTFHLRFLSDRDCRKHRALGVEHDATEDLEKKAKLINEAIHLGVVGWTNVYVWRQGAAKAEVLAYSPDADVTEFLTPEEKWELFLAVRNEPTLKEAERKKSSRPSTGEAVKSAPTAEPPENA